MNSVYIINVALFLKHDTKYKATFDEVL